MGNYVSKYILRNVEDKIKEEAEKEEECGKFGVGDEEKECDSSCMTGQQSTEKCSENWIGAQTPQMKEKSLPLDPRSITAGINRTPIEIDSTPVNVRRNISAIPRHLQSRQKYLETDIDKIMPRLTPKRRCVPRIVKIVESSENVSTDKSVEIELTITAITPQSVNKQTLTTIEEDRYKILGIDPRSPAIEFDRTPIISKSVECEKFKGSLENLGRRGSYMADTFCSSFTYCETSSEFITVPEIQALPDMVTRALKSMSLESFSTYNGQDLDEFGSTEIDNNSNEQLRNPEHSLVEIKPVSQSNDQIESEDELVRIHRNDDLKIIIWNDPAASKEVNDSERKPFESINGTIKQKTKDQIKNGCPKKIQTRTECNAYLQNKKCTFTYTKPNKIAKKREDENKKARTPLGNRSNNGQMISLKSPQQMLRKKNACRKMLQENTPPHKTCTIKTKLAGAQWDPDSTMLI